MAENKRGAVMRREMRIVSFVRIDTGVCP